LFSDSFSFCFLVFRCCGEISPLGEAVWTSVVFHPSDGRVLFQYLTRSGEGSRGTTGGGQGIDFCGVSSICGAGVPKMWPLVQRFFIP
jgi:hypothetical protein